MNTKNYLLGTIKCMQQGLYDDSEQMKEEAKILIDTIKYKALPFDEQQRLTKPFDFIQKLAKGHYNKYSIIKGQANRILKEFYSTN